jgi:pyridinium-3,5-biscarboxylic acid mononucleotide sulfurtransferase
MTGAIEIDDRQAQEAAAQEGQLIQCLQPLQPVAIAVSGGVDSLALATLAHRVLPNGTSAMLHAVSPAVPEEATGRVRAFAQQEGWCLTIFDAGEFENEAYRSNPINRCFHCKHNLYQGIKQFSGATILSGTNRDDLGEYRPGLEAARHFNVCHPYVEVGFTKVDVRRLAARLGLGHIAELPAAPCLASRVETGIRIEAETLRMVHRVEQLVAASLKPKVVRCRIRPEAIAIELDPQTLARLAYGAQLQLSQAIRHLAETVFTIPARAEVRFESYRVGSAFLKA